ncbi:MAG: hypothetical protein IIU65_05810, partial [Clostridia bacterium]|nr:hypothetical protein [Clostridia bacterium]
CTTMRYYKYSCKNCDYYYTDAADTDISGAYTYKDHVIDESTKVEFSSCVNHDGYYYTCEECGKENLKYIEHIGTHDIYSTNFTAPTETTAGSVTYKCNTCDFNKTQTIKAGEHIVTVDGVKYFTVDSCFFTPYQYDEAFFCYVDEDGNKYGSDALVKTDKDITLTKTTIDTHTHISDGTLNNVVPPTCGEKGYTEHKCEICKKIYEADFVDATNDHTEVIDKGYEPTCTTSGLTEGKHCSVCSEVLVKQEVIQAKGHTKIIEKGYAPTCVQDGLTDYIYCETCKEVFQKATVIRKTGHKIVSVKAVKPTYTKVGYTAGKRCEYCGLVVVKQIKIAKLKLKAPKNLKLTKSGNKLTVKYAKVKNAKGYQISIKIGSKWKNFTTKNLKYIKKLTKGKKYQVKVRAYVVENGKKVFGSYSSVKKIKL